jgi:hypothetical protein
MPKKSPLHQYRDEIIELKREKGLTIVQIHKYLTEKYGNVGKRRNLNAFISSHNLFAQTMGKAGFEPVEGWKHGWLKTKEASIFIRNEVDQVEQFNRLKEGFLELVNKHAHAYPHFDRRNIDEPHLLVVDPCDIHIGKICSAFETGEAYDSQTAVQRVREGVSGIIRRAESFPVGQVLLVLGNDILHIDNPRRQTTSGTPQDTDGMWYDNFINAKRLAVEVIEMLLTVADVHVVFNPSNHDFMSGFFLLDSVRSWFRNCDQVTFDSDMRHRKYYRWHNNLIGTTHGDGAKQSDLPLLMAQESGADWLVKHRYIYGHHVHHKTGKDYGSVSFETMRSPSGADGWHHRNGYQHAPKAIEGFVHHPAHGQVSRLTYIF